MSGHCSGTETGAPTVILETGNGGTQSTLTPIEDALVDRTVVCAYDRAGVGLSDPPPKRPRPVTDVVADLEGFLKAAKIEPPYFVIGNSAGGVVAFMFVQANPNDVAGFVVMNAMPPPFTRWISAASEVESKQQIREAEMPDYLGQNPEQITFKANDSMLTEPLPASMPYAVMFDEDCGGDTEFCDAILPPLADVYRELAKVGDGGRFIWAKGAGHDIFLTDLALVVKTIDEVWDEVVKG